MINSAYLKDEKFCNLLFEYTDKVALGPVGSLIPYEMSKQDIMRMLKKFLKDGTVITSKTFGIMDNPNCLYCP